MSSKILVADDSLTIQKVINITLSSSGYNLNTANSYQELVEKLKDGDVNLVLLDFNLSENIDGYSLAKKIKELSPSSKIIMMYGTFDNVDDEQLSDNDVFDKVIKPFESNLFIQKCIDALGDTNITPVEEEPVIETENQVAENLVKMENVFNNDDDWVMNSPLSDGEIEEEEEIENSDLSTENANLVLMESAVDDNILASEIEDWGMSIPAKLDSEDSELSLPPEIADDEIEEDKIEIEIEDDEIKLSTDHTESRKKPALQSIHELVLDEDESELPLGLDSFESRISNTGIVKIEELTKEVEEEIDADNFWAADDDDANTETNSIDPESTQEIIPLNLGNFSEEIKVEEFATQEPAVETAEGDIVEALFEKVKPLLDEKIEEYIKKHLDNSAWEIIPDLAENVIKEEVRRISNSVLEAGPSIEE